MSFMKLFRRGTGHLFELPAKMLDITVTASIGNLCNRIQMMSKIFFGQTYSAMNNILHTREAKRFLVHQLQVPRTDVYDLRHF